MRKQQENFAEKMRDGALGYSAIVLGMLCFLLALAVVTIAVRVLAGAGA